MIMPDGCSLPDGPRESRRNLGCNVYSRACVYRKLIAAKAFEPHWFRADTLRARGAHTTFKTLKTDRGTVL
jgi:hypothetical protein